MSKVKLGGTTHYYIVRRWQEGWPTRTEEDFSVRSVRSVRSGDSPSWPASTRQIAEAEALIVAEGDDDTLKRAAAILAVLRKARQDVEGKLRPIQ